MNYERLVKWLVDAGVPATVAAVVAALVLAGFLLLAGCAAGELVVRPAEVELKPSASSSSKPELLPSAAVPPPPG